MTTITESKINKQLIENSNVVDIEKAEFGHVTADHMFVCDFKNGDWRDPSIVPFSDITISPTALGIHYGQSVFEGMKVFNMVNGDASIFRIDKHLERLNRSLDRMCMPSIPYNLFEEALVELVRTDRNWIPTEEGSALYIRPFMFASEPRFGVKISEEYKFMIFTGPVKPYYQKPLAVKVEREYIRAAKGGTGFAKCAGNYGGSLYPTMLAKQEGFDQVLWLDAKHHEYIEESGTMNVMFVIDDTLVTPPLSDSILDGVTRDSLIELAKDLDIAVAERPIGVTELKEAFSNNTLTEAFGAGTAAVVAPIATIGIDGKHYRLPGYSATCKHMMLKKAIEDIRSGKVNDPYNWNYII